MKNGSQLQQGKPVMSARPPARTAETILSDLEKVAEITEVPSRAAAHVLAESANHVAAPAPAEVEPAQTPKAKPAGKGRAPMPWDELANSTLTQQTNFKLPVALLAKLKFLGETTYGESQTSIVKKALELMVEKMLKERGLS